MEQPNLQSENNSLRELVETQSTLLTEYKEQLDDLRARVKAQKIRIDTLEERMLQRTKATVIDYQSLKAHFDSMHSKIIAIFLEDIDLTDGLTYAEIQKYFSRKYPMISATNVPRSVVELVKDKKLYRHDGEDGIARFYLMLKQSPEKEESLIH